MSSYGMNARSSGTIDVGVSKNGPAPSGSTVIAPSLVKKVAICCWAASAYGAPGPVMFVMNACGFLVVPEAIRARSFRKSVARAPFCVPDAPREVLVALGLRPLTPHGGCFAARQ